MRTLVILAAFATALGLACGSDDTGAGGGDGSGGSGGSAGCGPGGSGGVEIVDVGVQVSWTLEKGGASASCGDFPAQNGVEVVVTGDGGVAVASRTFDCRAASGTVPALDPGDYSLSLALVDGSGLALVSAGVASVTLDPDVCDGIESYPCSSKATCVRDVAVVLR